MSEKTICTIEELKTVLKKTVSGKRFLHSLGVAETTEMLLEKYKCTDFEKEWNGFSAGNFCGIAHDFARELSNEQILEYCKNNKIDLTYEQQESPVLAHGIVSAQMVEKLVGPYPKSWKRAIEVHTTGSDGIDDLALALFAADFIEPTRTFLSNEKRKEYLEASTLCECEYKILCDMISHWKKKGYHDASEESLRLLNELERKLNK